MKRFLLFLFTVVSMLSMKATNHLPNAWINEFHYDNASGDEGEAVEIVIENMSDFNLELLTLEFYNGNNGEVYKTLNLKDSIACGTEGVYSFFLIRHAGIQNGAPDGFALSYNGHLLQFISYEGELTATDGLANGQTSVDVGVEEGGTTEIGQSLQLSGAGNSYADYTWAAPATSTFCSSNASQQFIVTVLEKDVLSDVRIYAREGSIVIENSEPSIVTIFDMSGRMIKTVKLEQGEKTISSNYKGLVLVRVSNKVYKLVLK